MDGKMQNVKLSSAPVRLTREFQGGPPEETHRLPRQQHHPGADERGAAGGDSRAHKPREHDHAATTTVIR